MIPSIEAKPKSQLLPTEYDRAEQQFIQLLETEDLDKKLAAQIVNASEFEKVLNKAIEVAYAGTSGDDSAHRFLQRVLYRINRLKLFWYDDLRHYTNERSLYLRTVRDQIEEAWQEWEAAQLNVAAYQGIDDIGQALRDRFAADVDPAPSADGLFYRDRVTEIGYRRLVAIASLDGLVEASQLSRTLGGVGNEVHAVLTRLLIEEYGGGRLSRKHSSHFTTMLEELGMLSRPEAYFDLVPWQLLAIVNHSFLLTERKRYFLRYIGGLLYGELSVPATFRNYQAAGERLGFSAAAMSYWNLHIKVDELHGRWMLDDVAIPLVALYPADAWELVFGYDQQRLLSDRAGTAVAQAVREAQQTALKADN
ncbi:iron-containing redox enzyme family protein [Floridanema aerugineum]|uniref:Iron-containing redox enzyme family protein n=1 Tax=Floridaenema aerugineum BLCC-F46 TaxID=3153654 RepID=A0ABV4XC68_9CYAN